MLLGYPVITSGIDAHRASFERSLGEKYDEFIDEVSIEKRVDKDTPPAFIWHTCEDKTVPLENSLLMVEALRNRRFRLIIMYMLKVLMVLDLVQERLRLRIWDIMSHRCQHGRNALNSGWG